MPKKNKNSNIQDINTFELLRTRAQSLFYYYGKILETGLKASFKRGEPTWRILRYERITNPEDHILPLSKTKYVRPKTFEKQLLFLKKNSNLISLETLVELIADRKEIPKKTIALTFDNGHTDFHKNALPLLFKYKVPATLFIYPSLINSAQQFWSDTILYQSLALFKAGLSFNDCSFANRFFTEEFKDNGDLFSLLFKAETLIDILKRNRQEIPEVIKELSSITNKLGGIEIERNFLSLDELIDIKNYGISLGIINYDHSIYNDLEGYDLIEKMTKSKSILKKLSVDQFQTVAAPEGLYNLDSVNTLNSMGVKNILSADEFDQNLDYQTKVLGRIPIFEFSSFCNDYFALRIWGRRALNF